MGKEEYGRNRYMRNFRMITMSKNNMELTAVHATAKIMPTTVCPYFTKPFTIDGETFKPQGRKGSGSRVALRKLAKIGQKIAWINYDPILHERLKGWELGCFVAENDEGKYLMLVLPAECERKTEQEPKTKKWFCSWIWAPDDLIAKLQEKIGDLPAFFASKAADYITSDGKRQFRIRSYFQIFDDIEVMEPVTAK